MATTCSAAFVRSRRLPLMRVAVLLWIALSLPSGAPARAASSDDPVVSDLDDRPVSLHQYDGKLVVLLHEDREASTQNRDFKTRLGKLSLLRRGHLMVIALADVSIYDFWPAKRYVKAALRRLQDEDDALVLCDWKGVFRRRFALRGGESALLLRWPDGHLELARRGELSPADAAALLDRIDRLTR